MRDSVPSPRYSPVCNVLRQWSIEADWVGSKGVHGDGMEEVDHPPQEGPT